MTRLVQSAAALLLLSLPLFGDDINSGDPEGEKETERLVVTGTKFEQSSEEATENIEVITAEDIEQSGAKNLTEALDGTPGVVITGHPTDAIMIQGFSGDYVKILIDGIEVAGNIGGSVAVHQISTADIERIEIIKGASSALYGSDAIGGVVNIVTKKKQTETADSSLVLTQELGSNLRSFSQGHLSYADELRSFDFIGSFDYDGGKTKEQNTALAGKIDNYLVPHNRLGAFRTSMTWFRDKSEVGAFVTYADSLQILNTSSYEKMEYDTWKADAGIKGMVEAGDLLSFNGFVSAKLYDLRTLYTSYSDDSQTLTESNFIDVEGEVRSEYEPGISHSFLFGLNAKTESIEGDSFDGRKYAGITSFFAQDTWNTGAADLFFIVPGFRFDFSPPLEGGDAAHFQFTPKLSLRYNATDSTVFRASYGMGYKTPTLKQKYWVFLHNYASGEGNFILYGNPDLEPEMSHGFNLSAEQKGGDDFIFSLSGYYNSVYNLIDTEITGNSGERYIRTYRNVNKAMTYGGEASIQFHRNRFTWRAGYSYTGAREYSEDDGKYIDMDSRVPHRMALTSGYLVPWLETNFSLHADWNSPQLIDYEENSHTPDYLMLSLRASKKFADGKYELYCAADNLLNNRHFVESSYGDNQEEYFELYDGFVFTIGGRLKF